MLFMYIDEIVIIIMIIINKLLCLPIRRHFFSFLTCIFLVCRVEFFSFVFFPPFLFNLTASKMEKFNEFRPIECCSD